MRGERDDDRPIHQKRSDYGNNSRAYYDRGNNGYHSGPRKRTFRDREESPNLNAEELDHDAPYKRRRIQDDRIDTRQ